MRILLALLVGLAFPAAATQQADIRGSNPSLACGSQGPYTFYFPANTFPAPPEYSHYVTSDAFHREWFSRDMAALGEPSLTCEVDPKIEAIRFVWLRSFHGPISIRAVRTGDTYRLFTTEMSHPTHDEDAVVVRHTVTEMSPHDWATLLQTLTMIRFQEMPSQAGGGGNDGSVWIIEARLDGVYRVAERWMGGHGTRQVGLWLYAFSGLNVPLEDFY